MPLPSELEIEFPLLIYIYNSGGTVKSNQCYSYLAKEFDLSLEEIDSRMERDGRAHWNNKVQWARKRLVDHGFLFNAKESGKGIWKITNKGTTKAESLLNKKEIIYPDDIDEKTFEGAKKNITVNFYERSKSGRDKCIDHYGCQCSICSFDFEKTYGIVGKDFIHVHHIIPISQIGKIYELNPIKDLRPVCPNCHAMLHKRNPPFSIEEVKTMIRPI